MGALYSGDGISGDTLKGLGGRFTPRRAGPMVLHLAFVQVQWPA
jgi:hypothetical protein